LVAHLLLAANNSPRSGRRTLRATTPYHSRFLNRRKEFVLSEKPEMLRHLASLHKKVLKQYRTVLKRQRTPIEEAEFYARQMESRRLQSIAALARLLKLSPDRLEDHLQLLGLPDLIRKFLAEHRRPEYVRYFSTRKLRQLLRLDDRSAWRRFQSMVREAERKAGIWRAASEDRR
jgi:hypothetical protein